MIDVTGAACQQVDPEVMFPDEHLPSNAPAVQAAKDVCRRCPFMDACLTNALENRIEFGVWGGLDHREREALRKRRYRHFLRVGGQTETLFEVSA